MNNSITKRSAGAEELVVLLNIIIVALMVSGLKGIANYFSFAFLLVILWIVIKHFDIAVMSPIKWFVLFIIYYSVTSMINLNTASFLTDVSYYVLAFSPLLIYNIISHSSKKYSLFTLKGIALIWGFMTLYSIYIYLMNPMAARESSDMFAGKLFGGYFFAYGSSLLCVYCFSLLFDERIKKTFKTRIVLLIAVVVLMVVIFMTNSTITTFATILGVSFTLIFDRILKKSEGEMKKKIEITLILVVSVAVYMFIWANIDRILSWLSDRNDVLFFKRVEELINGLLFDDTTTHYEKRADTLTASIQLFFESPILGVGYRFGNAFSEARFYGIGDHSAFLDTFARYGVVGAIPLIATYFYAMKDYCKRYLGVLLAFIVLVVFNPFISYQSNLIIFLFIPLLEHLLNKQADDNKLLKERILKKRL